MKRGGKGYIGSLRMTSVWFIHVSFSRIRLSPLHMGLFSVKRHEKLFQFMFSITYTKTTKKKKLFKNGMR